MLNLKLVRGAEYANNVRPAAQVPSGQLRFVIGRDPKCDWHIADRELALSARHCEIVREGGRQVLKDLSTNGTFVNGARKRLQGDHEIEDGDRLELGNYLIEVELVSEDDTPTTAPASAAAARPSRRGRDPAEVAGTDWQHAEISAPVPSLDMNSGFTRISKPWLDTSTEEAPVFTTVPNVGAPSVDDVPAGAAARPKAAGSAGPVTAMRSAGAASAASATSAQSATSASGAHPAHSAEGARRANGASEIAGAGEVLLSLAAGLGIATEELRSSNPVEAAHRVARLLRVAVLALHEQMLLQSRQMSELGSHASMDLASSPAARLRIASQPEDAVRALMAVAPADGETMLAQAHGELADHAQRLLAAFGSASRRMGEQLDPATLAQALPGGLGTRTGTAAQAVEMPARLWRIYGTLWTAMGERDDLSWPEGFVQAAASYFAASYDEPPAEGPAAR